MRSHLILFAAPALFALQSAAPADRLQMGGTLPAFSLQDTDGRLRGPAEAKAPIVLVIFLSAECPYVRATEQRINALAKAYAGRVDVFGINSNDERVFPEESLEGMKARREAIGYAFPYLKDADSQVARRFGARCTPDFFLFGKDRKLVYHGRLDDNWSHPESVTKQELRDAVEAVLHGGTPEPGEPARGCGIKWR
jgi:thiol-disulfide isomerase/thioredoxin